MTEDTENSTLLIAITSFFGNRVWDHFGTFTTVKPSSILVLRRAFDRFARVLALICQRRICFVAAIEPSRDQLILHVHALLSGTEQVGTDRISRLWKSGNAQVKHFEPGRRTIQYLAKGGAW